MLPAELAYGALVAALGERVEALVKELEIYATDEPPDDYALDLEVAGVLREADARGWEQFHLVGYSGGGAVALVLAATHRERLLSLALLEPAWAGAWDMGPAERAVWEEFGRINELPADERMQAFVRAQLAPGIEPPPAPVGGAPPWMAKRPAGIAALTGAFQPGVPGRAQLARFERPVYFVLGGLSNQNDWAEMSARLATAFRDFEVEVFEERHHFDPPHRIEPERLARSLTSLWRRAEEPPAVAGAPAGGP